MNINGKNLKNIIYIEKEKLLEGFARTQIGAIEKKILMASNSGYDYVWYKISNHYKYNNDEICFRIIKILEENSYYVRLFENNILQIIW